MMTGAVVVVSCYFRLSAMLFEPLKKFGHLLLGVGFAVGVVAIELPPHV